jgi:hypothetical protein
MVGFTPEPSILHRTDLIDLTLHGPNVRMHQIYNLLVLVLLSLLVRRVRLGGKWELGRPFCLFDSFVPGES